MEIRKDSLSAVKLCRFCLSQDSHDLRSLYNRSGRARNSVPLPMKILSSISVEVFPSDKMPSYICSRCSFFMDITYEFKQICRQADESILQYVQTGSSMKPITWPTILTKAYESSKSAEGFMKTVVHGGATVEVTSQDMSDEDGEDDDENVYKVKIGDGNEEARIKVITGDDTNKPKKDWETSAPRGMTGGCWSCDECDCTYPLQQLLELHKMQKHRARNVSCHLCDAKFFSKYDLSVHQLRHSNEMPFECVACGKKFKRFTLLKRHERLTHSNLPHLKCPAPDCKATFLSAEQLHTHSWQHERQGEKNFSCDQCDKKFHERSTLRRHKATLHSAERQEWSCEYCPERFSSVTKLSRHVRTHAGERPYPCKYCDKSFTKSHHHTRHVRVKHADQVGAADAYRCEQCCATFTSQDDLMYHSAIHATQDLTCPLCHEKFENVDGVTTHIKSHVTGMEFMCDYCELVFTAKHKLDVHILMAHEDEMHNDAGHDESSMEMDQDDDDNAINVKEVGDHMVVEITKPGNFILSDSKGEIDYKAETDNTCSEESETDATFTELSTVETLNLVPALAIKASPIKVLQQTTEPPKPAVAVSQKTNEGKTATILRKAEEVKRKPPQKLIATTSTPVKKEEKDKPVAKVESNNSGGNDKSLKLLEKEIEELQRTNAAKTPAKPADSVRTSRRPQLNTSTPKLRPTSEKKQPVTSKTPLEKKAPERRAIKENKEPKEDKEKANNSTNKEEKEKTKEKDTPKSAVKNGANDKSADDSVRRSTRPSKVKDYAKMAQQRNKGESDDDSGDGDDEEYKNAEEVRAKTRRSTGAKPPPKAAAATPAKPAPKKRGRPRKEQPAEVPAKIMKESNEEEQEPEKEKEEEKSDKEEAEDATKEAVPEKNQPDDPEKKDDADTTEPDRNEPASVEQKPVTILRSPMGQTLKKVPIKSLPPGIKPLPLPPNVRPMSSGISEMQIGKKMVKVQKIVMTKAEVETMAKRGLLQMKDGTMMLKPGIKFPSDLDEIKSSLIGDTTPESPSKNEKSAPARCDIGETAAQE